MNTETLKDKLIEAMYEHENETFFKEMHVWEYDCMSAAKAGKSSYSITVPRILYRVCAIWCFYHGLKFSASALDKDQVAFTISWVNFNLIDSEGEE